MGSLRGDIRKYESEKKVKVKGPIWPHSGVCCARVHSSAVAEPRNLLLSSRKMTVLATWTGPNGWSPVNIIGVPPFALGLRQMGQREALNEMIGCIGGLGQSGTVRRLLKTAVRITKQPTDLLTITTACAIQRG